MAPAVKHFFAVWLSAVSTSAPCLRPSSVAFIILLLVSSLHKKPSFLHILIGTFDFLSLPTPPQPPTPSTPLSEWPARTLWGACCSRWKAGAVRCRQSAAPWPSLPPCSRAAFGSGRRLWIVAGRPCILGRTSRAAEPWAERRRGYSATAQPGEPCGMEWMHIWNPNQANQRIFEHMPSVIHKMDIWWCHEL